MSTRICPRCNSEVTPDPLQGLCPRCVGAAAFLATFAEEDPGENSFLGSVRYFGDYELVEEVARGGMGVVFKARQVSLDRIVAIKMILTGRFAAPSELQRFYSEAQTAATLQHPNIVRVHEVGEHEGQSYFSMDFITGASLAELARNRPLPPRRAAEYVRKIAAAIHYAHQKGIIHRDLKPSNVLIDAFDEPRITDFGLAKKIEEQTDLTLTGEVVGTPSYLAPEMASGNQTDIGPASDIYSLGALLYFLLTGRPPFVGKTLQQTLAEVVGSDPTSPRVVNPAVPRDLDTICLKCLEKKPSRRYGSAQDLSDELGRFLQDRPIHARPIGPAEKAYRWCRRHPSVAALSGAVGSLLIALAIGSTIAAFKIETARRGEVRERQSAASNAVLVSIQKNRADAALLHSEFQRAEDFLSGPKSAEGMAALAQLARLQTTNKVLAARLISALTFRNWPLPAALLEHSNWIGWAQFSPDGSKIATGSHDNSARVWDWPSGRMLYPPLDHGGTVTGIFFTPDGRRLLTTSRDKAARVWDVATGTLFAGPLPHDGENHAAALSPDGTELLTSPGDQTLRLFELPSGRELRRFPHESSIERARLATNGTRIVASAGTRFYCWNGHTSNPAFPPRELHAFIADFTLSRDHSRAVLALTNAAIVLDLASGEQLFSPLVHPGFVQTAQFSVDGSRIVTGSEDGTARLWETRSGRVLAILQHAGPVRHVDFSPNGRFLLTTSQDTTVRLWDAASGMPLSEPLRHNTSVSYAQVSPDDNYLISVAGISSRSRVWDIRRGDARPITARHTEGIVYAEFSADSQKIVSSAWDNSARMWDATTLGPIGKPLPHAEVVNTARFNKDGDRVVTASTDGTAALWNAQTSAELFRVRHKGPVITAELSPDGTKILTGSYDRTAIVWDAHNGRPLTGPLPHNGDVLTASFDAHGRRVLTASTDGLARIFDANSGQLLLPPIKVASYLRSAKFSHSGDRFVSLYYEKWARVWNALNGETVSQPMPHRTYLTYAEFSPDDRLIATASEDYTARIWNATLSTPVTPSLHHEGIVRSARFSPQGTRLVTASEDKTARVWDAATGWAVSEPLRHQAEVRAAIFSPNGQRLLTAAMDGALRVWDLPEIPGPAPAWLPDLAEAVAQRKLEDWVDFDFYLKVRSTALQASSNDFYSRWATWFFGDRSTRSSSPFARE